MATLDVILGAGFSFDAKLPLVKTLSTKFQQDYNGKLLKIGSSEWYWIDQKNEQQVFQGRLNSDHVAYAYFMNEVVRAYNSAVGQIDNYELFYDYLENQVDEWYKIVSEMAVHRYQTEVTDQSQSVINRIRVLNQFSMMEIINYLIADSLQLRILDESLATPYIGFINHLKKYDKVNIHTLNHDLLIEKLCHLNDLPASDGFIKENSELISGETDEQIPTFLNSFPKDKISLIKLHGSINIIRYRVGDEKGAMVYPTGRIIYYKPETYGDKHRPIRVNPDTMEHLQLLPDGIVPQFITGVNKPNKIEKDYMYKELFKTFENNLATATDCLLIGYGYFDDHVNEIIRKLPKNCNVTNVNPTTKFPYHHDGEVHNFDFLKNALPLP